MRVNFGLGEGGKNTFLIRKAISWRSSVEKRLQLSILLPCDGSVASAFIHLLLVSVNKVHQISRRESGVEAIDL